MKIIAAVLLLSTMTFAQSTVKKENHRIFTLNHLELTLAGGTIGTDGFTSRKLNENHFMDGNPIVRPFVKSNIGTIGYFSGSFVTLIEANHLLRNHTKVRHVLNWSVIGTETYFTINNFRFLKSNCANVWIRSGIVIPPCHI
jgi:hypothetical protein